MRKKAYICAPYRGKNKKEVEENVRKAARYSILAYDEGWLPVVVHPIIKEVWGLDTTGELVDQIITNFNMNLLKSCDALIICGLKVSKGMKYEIDWCKANKKSIIYHKDWGKTVTGKSW